jgi:hypothetical protein
MVRIAMEGVSMTEPKYVTLPTGEKRQAAVGAYALAVGKLSGAWNYLHGALGDLFALVIGGDAELVLAAWRSIENDRAQREMLRAVIKAASPGRWKQTPTAPADLLWVLSGSMSSSPMSGTTRSTRNPHRKMVTMERMRLRSGSSADMRSSSIGLGLIGLGFAAHLAAVWHAQLMALWR